MRRAPHLGLIALLGVGLTVITPNSVDAQRHTYSKGQPLYPAYEGWVEKADGSIAMLWGSNWIREQLIAGRIDLVRAVGDVQTRSAISHLWVEELVTGDDVDRVEIANHLARSAELMELIIELERDTQSWLIASSKDAELPELTGRAKINLERFSEISQRRSRWVAAMTRTSTGRSSREPTGRTTRSCRTRRSAT